MDFVVNRHKLSETATIPAPPLVLHEGEILIRILKFAFTANNVSYAATGDALGYWKFFPQQQPHDNNTNDTNNRGWGSIPVWGVGVIVASRCANVTAPNHHRRVYGYFPMSHYVVMRPIHTTPADFIDGMPHRRSLPAVYNQYLWCDEDPFYTPRTEQAMMVLRPLFVTSWLLVDFFLHPQQHDVNSGKPFVGATTVIISSASSKTSIGLAFLLYQYNQQQCATEKIRIVGLTSPGNRPLVSSLQIYDDILLYDTLEQHLDATQPSCFVDMAGNTNLTMRLHQNLQDNMVYSCLVGASHVGQGGKPTSRLPGAKPKFFFAPSWTSQCIQELGRTSRNQNHNNKKKNATNAKRRGNKILLHKVLLDYQRFVNWCLGTINQDLEEGNGRPWLRMQHYVGPQQVATGYSECLQGKVPPDTAVIMSLWDDESDDSLSPATARL